MQERYLRELVTISSDPDTHLLAITVMSSSEQTSSNILTALLEQVNQRYPQATVKFTTRSDGR